MRVVKCETPSASGLERRFIDAAYYRDAYRTHLSKPDAGIVEIFRAIFAHHPMVMKVGLIVRNRLVRLLGLDAATTSELLHPQFKNSYAVGEKIGVWPILAITDTELIVGRDNKHLDFRLSVLKEAEGAAPSVVISTFCLVHNNFGKIYLFFVVPFHQWGVKKIISNAVVANRI